MVRSTHKVNILIAVAVMILSSAFVFQTAKADNPQNVKLQVNIIESLTVSVTDPDVWASGELDVSDAATGKLTSDFLRNKVNVTAATNNGKGVNVYMYTLNNNLVNLANASATIPTLAAAKTVENFDINHWGYSLKYTTAGDGTANPTGDTDILNTASTYNPIPQSSSSVVILDTSSTGTGSQDIFFGAKADETKESGTYAQTVYFAAVTGDIDTDPTVPITPVTPSDNPVDDIAYYDTNNTGATTYTSTTRNTGTSGTSTPGIDGDTTTTTTQVGAGDIRDSYAKAAGVTAESGAGTGRAIGTALAVAAVTSATSGFFFIILAKRRKDDDEEEEEAQE